MTIERTIDGVKFHIQLTASELQEAYDEFKQKTAIKIINKTIKAALAQINTNKKINSKTPVTVNGVITTIDIMEAITEEEIDMIAKNYVDMVDADVISGARKTDCANIALALYLKSKNK